MFSKFIFRCVCFTKIFVKLYFNNFKILAPFPLDIQWNKNVNTRESSFYANAIITYLKNI